MTCPSCRSRTPQPERCLTCAGTVINRLRSQGSKESKAEEDEHVRRFRAYLAETSGTMSEDRRRELMAKYGIDPDAEISDSFARRILLGDDYVPRPIKLFVIQEDGTLIETDEAYFDDPVQ